jgi:hypothetical protein
MCGRWTCRPCSRETLLIGQRLRCACSAALAVAAAAEPPLQLRGHRDGLAGPRPPMLRRREARHRWARRARPQPRQQRRTSSTTSGTATARRGTCPPCARGFSCRRNPPQAAAYGPCSTDLAARALTMLLLLLLLHLWRAAEFFPPRRGSRVPLTSPSLGGEVPQHGPRHPQPPDRARMPAPA